MPAVPPGGRRRSLAAPNTPVAGRPGSSQGPTIGSSDLTARWQAVFQPGNGIFSPNYPLAPVEPEQVRAWDFAPGWNLLYQPRHEEIEQVGFAELRALADHHDITRLAIETRKDQMEMLSWSIASVDMNNPAADAPDRIGALSEFWSHPDGERPFGSWLREALEDLLVIDAPTFEVRRNRGGGIIGLDVIDGATIKLLIDDTGRAPMAPAPAYEQVIRGRPWRLLTSDDIIYAPRNMRPNRVYGYGPVEQIVTTINIGLRRQTMQLQHFTDGNIPAGLATAPDGWSAEQIQQYQEWFNSILAGNTATRTQLIWGPNGAKYQAFKEAPYKDLFDEWLARVVCFAFSISPNALISQVQRTTADTLMEAALKEGLVPLKEWARHLVNTVTQRMMGHKDLQFVWDQEESLDPQSEATMLESLVKTGLYTLNEGRAKLGMDPIDGGDKPMVFLATGPVLVSDIVAPPAPGDTPPQAETPPAPDAPNTDDTKEPPPGKKPAKAPKPPLTPAVKHSHPGGHAEVGKGSAAVPFAAALSKSEPFGHRQRDHARIARITAEIEQKTSAFLEKKARHVAAQLAPRIKATAARKGAARTLYVHRPLRNADEVIAWAKEAGFTSTLEPDDMHVTIAFSRAPLDWDKVGDHFDEIECSSGQRSVEQLGDKGAVVLKFESTELAQRWQQICDAGASWDHDSYQPHVTLSYEGAPPDLDAIEPWRGSLVFGPEVFDEVDDDWADGIKEQASASVDLTKAPDDGRPISAQDAAAAHEAARRQAEALLAAIDLGDWSDLEGILASALVEAYADAYWRGLGAVAVSAGMPADDDETVRFGVSLDQVEPRAVAWAKAHAAEQVTGIEDRTRGMIRNTVAQSIEEGWGAVKLGDELAASQGFSKARAGLIGRTETVETYNRGNLAAYEDSGVATGKEWVTSGNPNVCQICLDNEAQGPIALEEDFLSGDPCPASHPDCDCIVTAVTTPPDEW